MAIKYCDYVNGDDTNGDGTAGNPYKTITKATTGLSAGDEVRVAKSPAPSSIGNATWTNKSKTVALASAQTQTVELCENSWTASANVTASTSTTRKQGSYSSSLAIASAFTTGKVAYKSFSSLNLSGYQKISFWIQNNAAITANCLKVCLCSDTAGDTIVDTFYIPAIPSTGRWLPLTIERYGGGNLGNTIQSIAIYADSDPGTVTILLDDFIACTTDGLNLQSLISKNSAEQGGTEGWYGIQSIDGTTILLDNDTSTAANAGRGYSGTTETVATYKRETIKTDLASSSSTAVQAISSSGSSGNNIKVSGGWVIATDTQNGETFFDGLNGYGYGLFLSSKSYITLDYFNVCRYNYGVYFYSSNNNTITTLSNANNNSYYGVCFYNSNNNTITTLSNANNNNNYGVCFYNSSNNNTITTLSNANNNSYYGVYFSSSNNNTITTLSNANNNNNYGVYFSNSNNNVIIKLSTSGNGSGGIYNNTGINYIYNALIAEATEVAGFTSFANARIYSQNHDQTDNNDWIFTDGGTINKQNTTTQSGSGYAWKMAITSSNRSSGYPLTLSIAKIAVAANSQVTFKAYVKKDHATNVGSKLICRGGQIAGVDDDVVATADNNTDWQQLTLTFTPTKSGVVEIEALAFYVSGNSNVYVDTIEVSQA